MVIDEAAVPKIYWEPREPRLNRQELASELKAGRGNRRRYPVQSRACLECEDTVMGFSAKQVQALRRSPNHHHIRTREAHGRELSYIEGGTRSRKPIAFLASTAGTGRRSNPNACSPAKIAGPS